MGSLFFVAATNTIVGLVLSILLYGAARVWRHPPVAPRALGSDPPEARRAADLWIDGSKLTCLNSQGSASRTRQNDWRDSSRLACGLSPLAGRATCSLVQ